MSSASQLASAPAPGASSTGGQDGDAAMGSLRRINGLAYSMAPSLSVVTTRTTREWPSSQPSYKSGRGTQTVTCVVSTGAAYVDGKNSYLKFDIAVAHGTASVANAWGWGPFGSALNLFNTLRLTHSSGYLVEQHQDTYNQWLYLHNAWGKTEEWRRTVLPMMQGVQKAGAGYNFPIPREDTFESSTVTMKPYVNPRTGASCYFTLNAVPANDCDIVSVAIPLSELSDLFDSDSLLPSFLMAGMRIELGLVDDLEQAVQGMVTSVDAAVPGARGISHGVGVDAGASVTLTNVRLALETVTLTDGITRSLAVMAANSGMQLPFNRIHSVQSPISAATQSTTVQINRALTRANLVCVVKTDEPAVRAYAVADTALPALVSDYIKISPSHSQFTSMQVKLGAEFFPNQPLNSVMSMFQTSQTAWGAFRGSLPNGISPKSFVDQAYLVSQTLEKSSTLSQSGVPIAANRDLNVDLSGVLGESRIVTYVPHVALASVFLDSVIIRS